MLSRRLLRVKVMQTVFAHAVQDNVVDYKTVEEELNSSIAKAHELYHFMMLLPIALRSLAEQRIENSKSKLRPTDEERNPNMRFVNNRLIKQMEENTMLSKYVESNSLTWFTKDLENPLKTIFAKMCESEYYKQYLEEEDSFENDAKFVIKFMGKELPQYEFLFDALEDECMYWNDEAEFTLSIVVKTLKMFDGQNGQTVALLPMFKDADDKKFVSTLLRKYLTTSDATFALIKKFSHNWDPERVALLDIVIIELAAAEMMSFSEIPIRITLNEYIELAKYYSTAKSNVFINGLLEKIVRQLVEDKKILPSQIRQNA